MLAQTRAPLLLYPLLAALVLALTGCPPSDVDGDGFTTEDDCDDENAAINPGADEVCDGADNDCDGTIDETDATDATTWYSDVDGDGYGDAADSVTACDQPPGRVLSSTDCDDLEALANPGEAEATCDGIDNDCDDATLDEPDEDADGANVCDDCDDTNDAVRPLEPETTWNGIEHDCDPTTEDEPDDDGDGATVCLDCDDTNDAVSPDLAEVTCDGLDNDCDPATEDAPDGDGDGSTVCDDCDDADPAVSPDLAETTCNGIDDDCDAATLDEPDADGDTWTVCTDCDDAEPAANPGAVEICDGINNDCDAEVDEADAVDALTWYEDVDGDGQGDDGSSMVACYQPPGGVPNDTDCDDGDASIYLGADEACDGTVDENCNGLVDDGCTTVEHCGYISADETWGPMEVHHVTCNLSVEGGASPTLTIEDWTTVTFAPDVGLYVGNYNNGELQVNGTGWVTFTSDDDTSPAPGDWKGIYFGSADTGSQITGAVIEYSGSNSQGNLHMYYADVDVTDTVSRHSSGHGLYANGDSELLIQGSTFEDSDLDGVHLAGATSLAGGSDATFTDNVLTGNDGFPMTLPANSAGELDVSSTFAGNGDDGVRVSGYVTADADWQAIDVPLLVTANTSIEGASNPEVTVQDGLTVAFESDVGLYVGNYNSGALLVEGAATGVLFTSWDDTPNPGDWKGVYFGSADTGSELAGLTIEYGGSNTQGNLHMYYADVDVTGVTSRLSSGHGIYANGDSELLIQGSTFQDNDLDGVHLAAGTALTDTSDPSFSGNALTGNGGFPMSLPADSAGQLDASSTFAGNDDDGIRIDGYVVADATWQDLDAPLLVVANVSIEGSSNPEVTVEDGATIAFETDVGLYVGNYNNGALFTEGASAGVLFTSWDDTPNPGDWKGIYFGSADGGSELIGAHLEYGGSNSQGNIHAYYADVVFSGGSSSLSSGHGLYANGDSELTLEASTFADNDLDGVHLAAGTSLEQAASPTFADNTLTGNGGFPLTIPADSGGMVDATSTFVGNDEDAVRVDGYVAGDATWQALDAPWLVRANVSVEGASSPELIVEDGATVLFEDGTGMYVGNYNSGSLVVDGFSAGVVFSAWDDTPSPGDWLGVYFGGADTGSDLLGLEISYGGGNGTGNLHFYYADGTVTDSTVSWSSSWGIYRQSANPTLNGVLYYNNTSGDLY